jgi:hypothetical protein
LEILHGNNDRGSVGAEDRTVPIASRMKDRGEGPVFLVTLE